MREAYGMSAYATIKIRLPIEWTCGGAIKREPNHEQLEELAVEEFWSAAESAIKEARQHSDHLREVARTMRGSIDSRTWRQTQPNPAKFFPADIEVELEPADQWTAELIEPEYDALEATDD